MKNLANAVGAKTARPCDSCVKRRARWYCAADDAFLCQSCDGLVHCANPLARRHERVRLNTAASPAAVAEKYSREAATWHHGFTRKARTPRESNNKKKKKKSSTHDHHDLVPEISCEMDGTDIYEMEPDLICQVPVLDPMVANDQFLNDDAVETKIEFRGEMIENPEEEEESVLNGFFPIDMELEEFAADMETLLGRGLDETESYTMEELGSLSNSSEMFKVEKDYVEEDQEEERKIIKNTALFNETVPFELSFDSETRKKDVMKKNVVESSSSNDECIKVKMEEKKNVMMLRLNYDSVITTWGSQGLPWDSREPPRLDIDINGCQVVSMSENVVESHQKRYIGEYLPSSNGCGDGGREARVSRYREKRRTRLFSKKIRYEVRKLNAEKRPRMKGRFVKRASLVDANSPLGVK
ncbi:unnamed protein product [Cochlearia groenlandica]